MSILPLAPKYLRKPLCGVSRQVLLHRKVRYGYLNNPLRSEAILLPKEKPPGSQQLLSRPWQTRRHLHFLLYFLALLLPLHRESLLHHLLAGFFLRCPLDSVLLLLWRHLLASRLLPDPLFFPDPALRCRYLPLLLLFLLYQKLFLLYQKFPVFFQPLLPGRIPPFLFHCFPLACFPQRAFLFFLSRCFLSFLLPFPIQVLFLFLMRKHFHCFPSQRFPLSALRPKSLRLCRCP